MTFALFQNLATAKRLKLAKSCPRKLRVAADSEVRDPVLQNVSEDSRNSISRTIFKSELRSWR